MRVLVTGGSGLVGRYVVDELARLHDLTVLDIKAAHRRDVEFVEADVLSPARLFEVVKGFDAVVHLAGIPHPLNEPGEKVFRVNAVGTFNVLEAAARNGIKKFVLMSSESTLGFAFSTTRTWPEYLPIDELHPLRPQDPYGLSKVVCEELCAGYSRKSGLRTVSLRAPWIWVPEPDEQRVYRRLIAEYDQWSKNLWAYVHVYDVARAVRLALEAGLQNHEVFFVCADHTWVDKESRELASRFYPETRNIAEHFSGRDSFISNGKAKKVLGFFPQCSTADILKHEHFQS